MKQSMLFAPTLREVPKEAEITSHQLLLRGGFIKQTAAGIYTYLPLAYRVIQKIEKIIREEHNKVGCSELLMPALQPKELWEESGRWSDYGRELMRLTDRHDREFCLGPTHEEIISFAVRDYINSYKKLPLALYQIQSKFRDELRPRFGLMRGREFIMKDLYSFHTDKEDLDKWYGIIWEVYKTIFDRCGLDTKVVNSDTGQIGGDEADEFMVMSEVGEDTITYCDTCDYGSNIEFSGLAEGDVCPKCGQGHIKIAKGIEVGNIFKLGTKYSVPMNLNFIDQNQKQQAVIMGCYGLGVSRTLMALAEQHNDEFGLVWPKGVAPFDIHVVVADYKKEDQVDASQKIYNKLIENGYDVLYDDRPERAGVKFKDADLIGIPLRITVGRKISEGIVEIKNRQTLEVVEVAVEDLFNKLVEIL